MEFLGRINWVDCFVLILLIRNGYVGFLNGVTRELLRVLDHTAVVIITFYFYAPIARRIAELITLVQSVVYAIVFFGLYFFMFFALRMVYMLLGNMLKSQVSTVASKVGGLIFGLCKSSILISLILINLMFLPTTYFKTSITRSILGRAALKVAPFIYDSAGFMFPGFNMPGRGDIIKRVIAS
ncbi:MAG: CvpA family protein [Candidatus Omnitrophota bacterium]